MTLTPCAWAFSTSAAAAEDAAGFHAAYKAACDKVDPDWYPRFKQWCDEYFYLRHRQEQRGIGGIFFDDFSELGQQGSFAMLRSVGDSFLEAYLPIVEREYPLDDADRTCPSCGGGLVEMPGQFATTEMIDVVGFMPYQRW